MQAINLVGASFYAAFQRLFLTGTTTEEGFEWKVGPAEINEIAAEEARLFVVPPADVGPIVESMRMMVSDMASVSQTPMQALSSISGTVPSGYALRVHYIPLENKCAPKMGVLRHRLQELNSMLFRLRRDVLKMGDWTKFDTRVHFDPSLPIDRKEQTEIVNAQVAGRLKSRRTGMQEIGIKDVEKEENQIRMEAADDMSFEDVDRIRMEEGT